MSETRVSYHTKADLRQSEKGVVLYLSIPMLPPASQSPNSRAHWAVKARERKQFMSVVSICILAAGHKNRFLKRARIDMEFITSARRRHDTDNTLIRGAKPLGDCLVAMGVIVGDEDDKLEWGTPAWTVKRKEPGWTMVRITEIR